jgi:hypothetical protein
VTGERLRQAGWRGPSEEEAKASDDEAGFTSSSSGVRALLAMRIRNFAARSDKKPFRVESSSSGWFRARMSRSYLKGELVATAYQHGSGDSGGLPNRRFANERRRKAGQRECSRREGHEVLARPVTDFRIAGDVEKNTAGL